MADSKKKKIAIYSYFSFPYLHGIPLRTTLTLVEEGYDVTLLQLMPYENTVVDEKDVMESQLPDGADLIRMELWLRWLPRFRGNIFKYVELILRFAWHAWRTDYDLYIGIDPPAVLPVYLGTRLKPQKVIYYGQELYAEQPYVQLRPLWRLIDRFLCPRVDAIIAADANRAQHMVTHYKAPKLPLVILNASPYQRIERKKRFDVVLREHGCSATKIALHQGGIEPGRIDALVEAAQYVNDDVVIVLIGGGEEEYLDQIEKRVKTLGVQDRFIILPPVPPHELWDFTASAHVGLVLYKNLGLNYYYNAGASLKLYEYLMAGLPQVTPDFPGFPEVVQDQGVGKSVDTMDPEAIAQAINAIVSDETEWQAMHERALKLAKEKYNWEIERKKFVGLCNEMLQFD